MPQNLTDVATFTSPVTAPQDGERVTADSANMGDGPVNPGLQALANRTYAIVDGKASFASLLINGVAGGTSALTAGTLGVLGFFEITAVGGAGTTAVELLSGDQAIDHGKLSVTDSGATSSSASLAVTSASLKYTGTGTGPGDANPGTNVALTNDLRAANITKAWGRFTTTNGGVLTLQRGINIASMGQPNADAADSIKVTFAAPMKDNLYSVTANVCQGGSVMAAPNAPLAICMAPLDDTVTARRPTTTHFFLLISGNFGVVADPSTVALDGSFHVDGYQDS